MAGLLDFFASSEADPKYASNMAFFSGLANRDIGGGLLAHREAEQTRAMREQEMQMRKMQIESQVEARKQGLLEAAQAREDRQRLLYGDAPAGQPPQVGAPVAGGGLPGIAPAGAQPQQGAGGLIAKAREFGIPEQAIQADMLLNNGKGIADMIFKRGVPDMQVANGYAFDKNRMGAGFLPQLSTSQNGQTSMIRIGPDGLPIVSAPQGAAETAALYKGIEARLGAAGRVNLRKNADGTESPVSELDENPTLRGLVGGGSPQMRPPGNPSASETGLRSQMGGIGADPAGIQREIKRVQNDLMKPLDEPSKAALRTHLADLQQAARDPRVVASAATAPGIGYGKTSAQETAEAAERARLVAQGAGTGNNAAKREGASIEKVANADDMLKNIGMARDLLKQGPTASGVGALADKGANFFGSNTKGAEVAAQLDTLSGWMVATVPRMEGPQSNFDVQNYKTMAALVGDRTIPVEQRVKALNTLEQLQRKYMHLNGGKPSEGGASGSFEKPAASAPPPQPMKGMVRGGYKFKGGNPSDPSSWEKQ